VIAVIDEHASTGELLDVVFSARFMPSLHKEEQFLFRRNSCVEADSNTSTVVLEVVGADVKKTRCLGVKQTSPLPEIYKYVDLALQVGEVLYLRQ
jgi:hypothetical protein